MMILAAMLFISISAMSISIYDIQYTTILGPGNNYPSLHVGTVVSTEGIVSGEGYNYYPSGSTTPIVKYVITEGSGAWKSIFINDPAHSPQLGDRVAITGTVNEVSGFTEIGSVTSYSVISTGNAIPQATSISPQNLQYNTGEAYEGVLIKLTNVKVSVTPIGGQFSVTANNYSCQISNGFYPTNHTWGGIYLNKVYAEIYGIINYASGQYRVNPRSDDDMIPLADITTISLSLEDVEAKKGETKTVRVFVSKLESSWNITQYRFKLGYDKRILRFVDTDTTLISTVMPTAIVSPNEDSVTISYQDANPIVSAVNNGVLLELQFKALAYGESVLDLTQGSFSYTRNDTLFTVNASALSDGKIRIPIKQSIAWLNIYNTNKDNIFTTQKNSFNPWKGEKIKIEYGSKLELGTASRKAIIRIYDVQGRLVATPVNTNMDNANAYGLITYTWDGRDRNKNLLPIGVYYCHLEIINRETGESDITVQPIVVADKLK